MSEMTRLACRCGKVHIEVEQTPIIATECHCNSCRAADSRFQALPAGVSVTEQNGGTRFVLYRKDRARFTQGVELLKAFRLKPDSPTRRVVAGCCNTPIFLEFKGGHWLSFYGGLWPEGTLPAMEVRTMTGDREDTIPLDGAVPSGTWPTTKFYGRLLAAWIAMGFKSPDITITGGEIHA